VVVPELVDRPWYAFFLHGHQAPVLERVLLREGGPRVVVASTPWQFRQRPKHA
jgi:hypothetical protein